MRISKSGPALPLKKLRKPNTPKSEEVQEVVLEPVATVAVGGMAVAAVMGVMRVVVFTGAMLRANVLCAPMVNGRMTRVLVVCTRTTTRTGWGSV